MIRNPFQPEIPSSKKNHLDIHQPRATRPVRPEWAKDRSAKSALPQKTLRKSFDGIHAEPASFFLKVRKQPLALTFKQIFRRAQIISRRTRRLILAYIPSFAPRKLVYGSLSGGVALGMVGMGFVGQLSGPEVSARSSEPETPIVEQAEAIELPPYNFDNDIFFEYFNNASDDAYEENIRRMVVGHPIEEMLPYIFEKDHLVAAFLIGIAKKESNWGKRVPVLEGQDCFNYWGYRGVRKMMGTGGHTCFNSRKDAVDTVAKRLETLIHSQKMDTPEKLIIWKCGYSCEGHSRESVKKWISDVDRYFREASLE